MLRKRWFLLLLVSGALAGCIAFNTTSKGAQPDLPVMEAQGKQTGPSDASPLVLESGGKLRKFMNDNEGTWAAVGAFGTIVVSAIAVYLAYAANKQQRQVDVREKKEELRGILDHLIDLRETVSEPSPSVKAQKHNLYLQAAQSIQKQVPDELTSADYIVLAQENKAMFSYKQAKKFAAKAVEQARSSSAYEKSTALRFLADTYYYYPSNQKESEIETIKYGRKLYKESIRILDETEENDHVISTKCFSYIKWAQAEAEKNNLIEAQTKLKKVFQLVKRIRDDFHLKIDLLIRLSEKCVEIGGKYFDIGREKDDKSLFQNGHDVFAAADNALNIAYRILPHFPGCKPQIDRVKAIALFSRCLHQLRSEDEPNEAYYKAAKAFVTPQLVQDHKLRYMWEEINSIQEERQRASQDSV